MKRLCLLLAMWAMSATTCLAGGELQLPGYQLEDGALLLQKGSGVVDPYFAMKALLTAEELGLHTHAVTDAWVAWLAPRQESNGSFPRFAQQANGIWRRSANADADDSTLALWISLLSRRYDRQAMPAALRASLLRARKALWQLRWLDDGVYEYATGSHLAYLMDNAEVYTALRDDCLHARYSCQRMRQLEKALPLTFWDKDQRHWRVATRNQSPAAFYPDVAAQLFPRLAGLPAPAGQPSFDDWVKQEGLPWLQQDTLKLDFPWGVLVLAALKEKRLDVANTWLQGALAARDTHHWNILEETVLLGLQQDVELQKFQGG